MMHDWFMKNTGPVIGGFFLFLLSYLKNDDTRKNTQEIGKIKKDIETLMKNRNEK